MRAVALLAAGHSQTTVAKELGVSQPTISKLARREDIKPLIEKAAAVLIQRGLAPAGFQINKTKANIDRWRRDFSASERQWITGQLERELTEQGYPLG